MADVLLTSTEEVIQLVSVSGASTTDIANAVNAHSALTMGVHGVGASTVASAALVTADIAAHNALATAHTAVAHVWTAGQTFDTTVTLDKDGSDNRTQLRFNNPGALVEAPWVMQTHSAGISNHDNVLAFFYNAYKNSSGTVIRIVDNEHVVRMGHESRWLAAGDPTVLRGMFEWNLDIETALTGTPTFPRRIFALNYDFDASKTYSQFGHPSDPGNQHSFYGLAVFVGDTNYAIDVQNYPGLFRAGIDLRTTMTAPALYSADDPIVFNFTGGLDPAHLHSGALMRVSFNAIGTAAKRVQNAGGLEMLAGTWTKGTSDVIITAYGARFTAPTIALFNAALVLGNVPTDANYCIYATDTNVSYFAGVINTGSSFQVDAVQVVGNRVIDARCDDTINSGDATTDGVIDALRDAMITHGLIAAA